MGKLKKAVYIGIFAAGAIAGGFGMDMYNANQPYQVIKEEGQWNLYSKSLDTSLPIKYVGLDFWVGDSKYLEGIAREMNQAPQSGNVPPQGVQKPAQKTQPGSKPTTGTPGYNPEPVSGTQIEHHVPAYEQGQQEQTSEGAKTNQQSGNISTDVKESELDTIVEKESSFIATASDKGIASITKVREWFTYEVNKTADGFMRFYECF